MRMECYNIVSYLLSFYRLLSSFVVLSKYLDPFIMARFLKKKRRKKERLSEREGVVASGYLENYREA